ncbi:MAG: MerR family transcriptional regulator [Thermodesulfobacteriota bacterium]
MAEYLRIGQLASRLCVNPKTIRYYEQLGIVSPKRGENGYRLFSPDDAAELRFVLRAKNLGLTLSEIKGLLEYARSGRCETVRSSLRELVLQKIAEIEARIGELTCLREELESWLQTDQGGLADHPSPVRECACVQPLTASAPGF